MLTASIDSGKREGLRPGLLAAVLWCTSIAVWQSRSIPFEWGGSIAHPESPVWIAVFIFYSISALAIRSVITRRWRPVVVGSLATIVLAGLFLVAGEALWRFAARWSFIAGSASAYRPYVVDPITAGVLSGCAISVAVGFWIASGSWRSAVAIILAGVLAVLMVFLVAWLHASPTIRLRFPSWSSRFLVESPWSLWQMGVAGVMCVWASSWRPRPGVCECCGYDLRGSPGPECPECGSRIQNEEGAPILGPAFTTRRRVVLYACVCAAAVAFILVWNRVLRPNVHWGLRQPFLPVALDTACISAWIVFALFVRACWPRPDILWRWFDAGVLAVLAAESMALIGTTGIVFVSGMPSILPAREMEVMLTLNVFVAHAVMTTVLARRMARSGIPIAVTVVSSIIVLDGVFFAVLSWLFPLLPKLVRVW